MSDLKKALETLVDQLDYRGEDDRGEEGHWLDQECDRIYDRLLTYNLDEEEMDYVEFFVNTVDSRPDFETQRELHAFLVGLCMGTIVLFGFEDEAVELLFGLADRFAEQFNLDKSSFVEHRNVPVSPASEFQRETRSDRIKKGED
jgi:hypothetical protein